MASHGSAVPQYAPVKTKSYVLKTTDRVVGVNFAGAVTLVLINAEEVSVGTQVVLKDESGDASTSRPITILPQLGEGKANAVINSAYESLRLYSDGANWFLY